MRGGVFGQVDAITHAAPRTQAIALVIDAAKTACARLINHNEAVVALLCVYGVCGQKEKS